MGKIIDFNGLEKIRERHSGQRIVHCHGVFDLLHFGHLMHLRSAKKHGEVLVVTVTRDRDVNKGPERPHHSERQRAMMLAALEDVDYVAVNKSQKALVAILSLRPDFYVKGPDYRDKQRDITGAIFEEEDAVRSIGGKLVFTDDESLSSTELINRHFRDWDEAQYEAIERVKAVSSLDEVLEAIESLARLKVLVVGEPIIDSYVFCQPEALSSKSPTVSARFLDREDHAGGSLAIANQLRALGCEVGLLITHGEEDHFRDLLHERLDPEIRLEAHVVSGFPTPRKTRFVAPFRTQMMFELTDLRADQWLHADPAPFCARLEALTGDYDLVLVADFGHGLFEGSVLSVLERVKPFLAVNVQTNSSNYGFNPFTKHKHYQYISIDERECRLGVRDRFSAIEELARKTVAEKIEVVASVTLGDAGSIYFDRNGSENLCPSFFKDVVDTTGAGDTYFAITSLLAKRQLPGPVVPFIGNCAGGLKTRILGNRAQVPKIDLVRTVEAILK